MNLSINPLTFQSQKIDTPAEKKKFLYDLSTVLSQITSAVTTIQSQVSTLQTQMNTAQISLAPSINILGTVSSNTAVNTNSSLFNLVVLSWSFGALTLTLNNLANGAVVLIQATNSAGVNRNFKLAATNPSGTAYTTINLTYAGGGTLINMIGTGQTYSTGVSISYVGIAGASGLALDLLGS